jgi:hypothetical protein
MATRHARSHQTQQHDEGASFGAWTLVWVLYGAKLATIVLVVWAEHSYQSAVFVTITTWFWLGPLLALGAAPLLFRYRLRRVRARRTALLASEWHIEPPAASMPSASRPRNAPRPVTDPDPSSGLPRSVIRNESNQ